MKRIAFLAALAATVCTVACNKNMDTQINEVPDPVHTKTGYCSQFFAVSGVVSL